MAHTVGSLKVKRKSHKPTKNMELMVLKASLKRKARKGIKLNMWSEQAMESAINEFRCTQSGGEVPHLRQIARAWRVPKSTLQRRVKDKVKGHCHVSGRPTAFSRKAEDELADLITLLVLRIQCTLLCVHGFQLTEGQVRDLASEYAKKNGITAFSQSTQRAGYYWLQGE